MLIGESLNAVEVYEPVTEKWSITKPMTTRRSRVGVTVLSGRLYAVGGYDGQSRLNTVEVFDPSSYEWWDVAPMNHRRRYIYMTMCSQTCIERPPVCTDHLFVFLQKCFSLKHVLNEPVCKDHLPVKTTFLVSLGWSLYMVQV